METTLRSARFTITLGTYSQDITVELTLKMISFSLLAQIPQHPLKARLQVSKYTNINTASSTREQPSDNITKKEQIYIMQLIFQ